MCPIKTNASTAQRHGSWFRQSTVGVRYDKTLVDIQSVPLDVPDVRRKENLYSGSKEGMTLTLLVHHGHGSPKGRSRETRKHHLRQM